MSSDTQRLPSPAERAGRYRSASPIISCIVLRFWGRGLATEGALASVGYGFEELGLERIISITLPGNTASCRVIGKVGLTYRGSTCWRNHDVVWYAAERREWGTRGSY